MSGLLNMVNEVKKLLSEAKMKNIFDSIESGDRMIVHFKNELKVFGKFQRFIIFAKNDIGFSVVAEVNKKQYTIHKDKITERQLEITDESNGKTYILPTTDISFRVAKLGGDFIRLDGKDDPTKNPVDVSWEDEESVKSKEDLNKRVIKFNQIIKSLKKDDNLQIQTRVGGQNDTDSVENILTFLVDNINENSLIMSLTWAEGTKSKSYYNVLNNKEIIVDLNNLIKVKKHFLTLLLNLRDSSGNITDAPLDYISDVGSGNVDGQSKTMSKKALTKIIKNDPTILKLFNTQPSIMKTLMGASPTGVYQLGKMLQKHKINNSYLTKGKHVYFRLISSSVGDSDRHGISLDNFRKREDPYYGQMISDTVIKYGRRGTNHFEIKLENDKGDGVYDVRIKMHNPKGKIKDYGPGIIEFTDIEN